MTMLVNVLTCDETNGEGRPVGVAQVCLSRRGRRILRIQMEALPVHGGLCIGMDEVLILSETPYPDEAPAPGEVLH